MTQHADAARTPTERDALTALSQLIGAETAESLWASCARALGVRRPVNEPAELRRMADHLMDVAELTRVAARSVKVRVITHEATAGTLS